MKLNYSELNLTADSRARFIFGKNGHFLGLLPLNKEENKLFGFYILLKEKLYKIFQPFQLSEEIEQIFIHSLNHHLLVSKNNNIHFYFKKDGFLIAPSQPTLIKLDFADDKSEVKLIPLSKNKIGAYWFLKDFLLCQAILNSKNEIKISQTWGGKNSLQTTTSYFEVSITHPDLPSNIHPLEKTDSLLLNFFIERLNHLFTNEYFPRALPTLPERWYEQEIFTLWLTRNFLKSDWAISFWQDYLNIGKDIFMSREDGKMNVNNFLWLISFLPNNIIQAKRNHFQELFEKWLKLFYSTNELIIPQQLRKCPHRKNLLTSCLLIIASQLLGYKIIARKEKKWLQNFLFPLVKDDSIVEERNLGCCYSNVYFVFNCLPKLFPLTVWRQILINAYKSGVVEYEIENYFVFKALAAKGFFLLNEDKLAKIIFNSLFDKLINGEIPGFFCESSSIKFSPSTDLFIKPLSLAAFLNLAFTLLKGSDGIKTIKSISLSLS